VTRQSPPADAPPVFASIVGSGLAPTRSGRLSTLAASILFHAVLLIVIVVVPLLFFEEILPVPGDALRAFFVAPQAAPPPPPPPPAPPAGARALRHAPAAARPSEPPQFVAPVEVPEVLPELVDTLDLDAQGGGVPGGVEGGVPGGVVGGIVGGLPSEPVGPPPRVVRIGGKVVAPKLVHAVKPEYPMLAAQARLKGIVILEALVGVDGRVKEVEPLRGQVILVDAAIEAVKQWRYMPLLLNGQPVDFILTVTVNFNLTEAMVTQ
jgi:protein TonB